MQAPYDGHPDFVAGHQAAFEARELLPLLPRARSPSYIWNVNQVKFSDMLEALKASLLCGQAGWCGWN